MALREIALSTSTLTTATTAYASGDQLGAVLTMVSIAPRNVVSR